MGDETKTVLLKVEIDQQGALTQLQQTTQNITALKESQKELNREYQQGKITEEQYAKFKVELETQLQREANTRKVLTQAVQAETNSLNAQKALLADLIQQRGQLNRGTEEGAAKFNALNGRIKELNTSIGNAEKASGSFGRNVGNYPALSKFNKDLELSGVQLGQLGRLLPLLVSPAGAAAAAIGALGATYSNSAAGAKDFAESQNQVKASFDAISNGVFGASGQSGGGIFTKITKFISAPFLQASFVDTNKADQAAEQLNKQISLSFKELEIQTKAAKLGAEARELTVQRQEQQGNLNAQLATTDQIIGKLNDKEKLSKNIIQQQVNSILKYAELTNNDIKSENNITELRKQYLSLLKQQQDIELEGSRRLAAEGRERVKITQEIEKQNNLLKNQQANDRTAAQQGKQSAQSDAANSIQGSIISSRVTRANAEFTQLKKIDSDYQKALNDSRRNTKQEEEEATREHQKQVEERIRSDEAYVRAQRGLSDLASTILGKDSREYKAFATAQAIASTYAAADKALEKVPFPANFAAMAGVIAEGLANVIKINSSKGFAEGGYTGAGGKYEPAGIVHKGEYVVPQHVTYSPKAQPYISALESMRGYADGGLVTSSMSREVNSEVTLSNAFKNMPQPVVSWKEGLITDNRIKFKEGLTTA